MAILNLKNATVQRVFFNGKGVALFESFKSQGQDRRAYFTAWFDDAPGVSEGDVVNVSGLFSVKSREYEKDGEMRASLDVSLNKARIQTVGATQQGASARTEPAVDAWADNSSELPF